MPELVIANRSGQEVGTVWSGYGGLLGVGGQGGQFSVGPYMYGMGSTPWQARDQAPPPMERRWTTRTKTV